MIDPGSVDSPVLPCSILDMEVVSDVIEDLDDIAVSADTKEDPEPDIEVACSIIDETDPDLTLTCTIHDAPTHG